MARDCSHFATAPPAPAPSGACRRLRTWGTPWAQTLRSFMIKALTLGLFSQAHPARLWIPSRYPNIAGPPAGPKQRRTIALGSTCLPFRTRRGGRPYTWGLGFSLLRRQQRRPSPLGRPRQMAGVVVCLSARHRSVPSQDQLQLRAVPAATADGQAMSQDRRQAGRASISAV